MGPFRVLVLISLTLLPAACGLPTPPTDISLKPSPSSATTSQPVILPTGTEVVYLPAQPSCAEWQSWPVIPVVGERVRALYQAGQADGNNAHAFSKIGDGEIAADWFFSAFDRSEDNYDLGPYQDLIPVIEHFAGSFGRLGAAARRGFNTERILDSAHRDQELCEMGESPLACELRLHRPAFAILSLGTNQVWKLEEFEAGMRQILDTLVSKSVVPILSTKGDNLEGDHRINQIVVCLAQEYEVPLWNFWAAIQPLPNQGLQPDREHLTYGIPDFDDEHAMQSAWTVRNLTALQALDAVWKSVTARP